MTAPAADVPHNSACPRCGAGFHCGMLNPAPGTAGQAADCWCLQQPHDLPVPRSASSAALPAHPTPTTAACFCPACLEHIRHEPPHFSAAPD